MKNEIQKFRNAAIEVMEMSDEEVRRGEDFHQNNFTCDIFGFLPRVLSENGHKKLLELTKENLAFSDFYRKWEEILLFSATEDSDGRKRLENVMKAAGLDCMLATVGSELDLHHSLHRIGMHQRVFDSLNDLFMKALCSEDIQKARSQNKTAIVCSANGAPVNMGMRNEKEAHFWIDNLYNFGIRVMHLTYNPRNMLGCGCTEENDCGLSRHGCDVVRHLNDAGIIVDVPHTGKLTTLDACKVSSAPVMATHTSCEAVYKHPRAKSDDELKAIADTGGLIGIYNISSFLGGNGTLEDLLEHIDHALNTAGADHVAIGTDLTYASPSPADNLNAVPGIPGRPKDIYDKYREALPDGRSVTPQDDSICWINWPLFTAALFKKGYSEEIVRKITGENFLRVFSEVCG